MVSNTQQTERIRARRHKNGGQRRKRLARAHGTPTFPIHQAGYDPNALITFMQTMNDSEKFNIRPYSYFRSHPYEGERIGNINRQITGTMDFRGWINKPVDKEKW